MQSDCRTRKPAACVRLPAWLGPVPSLTRLCSPCARPHVFPAALYEWRDALARQSDESTGYILPRAQLLKLAQAMPKTALGECGSGVGWVFRRWLPCCIAFC